MIFFGIISIAKYQRFYIDRHSIQSINIVVLKWKKVDQVKFVCMLIYFLSIIQSKIQIPNGIDRVPDAIFHSFNIFLHHTIHSDNSRFVCFLFGWLSMLNVIDIWNWMDSDFLELFKNAFGFLLESEHFTKLLKRKPFTWHFSHHWKFQFWCFSRRNGCNQLDKGFHRFIGGYWMQCDGHIHKKLCTHTDGRRKGPEIAKRLYFRLR